MQNDSCKTKSELMTSETGVAPSLSDDDIRLYLDQVIAEVNKENEESH
jgi:hypothetical protein